MKALQGVADVVASEQKLAAEREEYLLEELGHTAKDLLCIEPHPNTERQWVEGKIADGSVSSNPQASNFNFWSDRHRGFILATLQARVQQVQGFVESCKEALSSVHKAMYPMNEQLGRLSTLLRLFRQAKDMKRCVRQQLIGGAKVALAFVRVQNPTFNFREMHKLPPSADDRVDFTPHYAVVAVPAEKIIDRVGAETERLLREDASRR